VEKWKVDLWSLKLKYLAGTNKEMAAAHRAMTDRVLALEDELASIMADEERLALHRQLEALPVHEQYACASPNSSAVQETSTSR
jgi:hypothetical protein